MARFPAAAGRFGVEVRFRWLRHRRWERAKSWFSVLSATSCIYIAPEGRQELLSGLIGQADFPR